MENYLCTTCGTQYAATEREPEACAICADERQYVNPRGQSWTTHARLRQSHLNSVRREDEGILGIGVEPRFAIGQRALLLQREGGNVLWDCVPLLDSATETLLRGVGGILAIAISHPHYYSNMVDWAHAFGAPIYLHADDRAWVMRPDPAIRFWEGDTLELGDGLTLIRLGGHFAGSSVLHRADGSGTLLCGDTLYVTPDLAHVSVMYSFPNLVPLSDSAVRRIAATLEGWDFDRIHGAWWGTTLPSGAKDAVRRSLARYLERREDRVE